ncbi:MAG: hypothetical protein J6Z31_05100 [Fibrobacter sp.]|nr:hypothetical protein [Fibrobacter sp.]
MKLSKHFSKLVPLAIFSALIGCGSDSGSSASEDSSSSESSSSEESSSSYSNRLDVVYADTLTNDTVKFTPRDTLLTAYKFFLGEYPQGTLIRIIGKKSGGHGDSLFVREEQGEILTPEYYTVDASGDTTYNTQSLYSRLGEDEFLVTNFVTTATSGFYYVDIPKVSLDKDSSYTIRIAAEMFPKYFGYIGDTSDIEIEMGDTIRGVFFIGNSASNAVAKFSAETGKSINVNVTGKSLESVDLKKGKSTIATGTSIDEQILPETSSDYSVNIHPVSFLSYETGPYAYFEIITTSRDLIQGEYFANPDSIQKVGDTLTIVRERNDAAKYYLRQEEYVWLANLSKGDTLEISHDIEGYYTGASYPATYAVLNADGDSVASITGTSPQFVAPSKGAFYLHYVRLNSPPKTESQELILKTVIQRLNYVTKFSFYDEEKDKALSSKSVSIGDTLYFSSLALRAEPSDVSSNAFWYTPCEDLNFIRSSYTEGLCSSNGTEQLLSATNIAITNDAAHAGEIIRLIAQSKADPRARDTLTVYINE